MRLSWPLGLAIFAVGALIVLISFAPEQHCVKVHTKIISIGGCDRYGTCGFIAENGRQGYTGYPVVGARHTYEKCTAVKK